MAKCSKGFTLTELLTALVIHSFFILILGGTFYTLISFGSRSQMTMTARERGQRVINYIDSRVRNTGLGMWKLESSKEFRDVLAPLTDNNKAFYNSKNPLTLPVVVTHEYGTAAQDSLKVAEIKDKSDVTSDVKDKKIFCGNALLLLYAERATDKNFALKNGGYAKMSESELNLTDNTTILKEKIFQYIQAKIYEYYARTLYDGKLETIPNDKKEEATEKALKNFWEGFFDYGLTNAKKSFDISVYNSISNSQYKSLLKSIFDMYEVSLELNSDNSAQSDALKSMLIDLLNYVNNNDDANIFIPAVTSKLKPYSTFNAEFPHIFLTEEYNTSGKIKEYKEYPNSRFEKGSHNDKGKTNDIRSYAVLRGTGSPVIVNKDSLNLISCEPVLSGDELLYLKSVRVYAAEPSDYDKNHGQQERNLKVQKLDGEAWSNSEPYQQGILEIYAELDAREDEKGRPKNILSVWVLSSGGKDNMTHERPVYSDWPEKARWEDDYKYYVTYVSKGTWKLNNLPEDFTWN